MASRICDPIFGHQDESIAPNPSLVPAKHQWQAGAAARRSAEMHGLARFFADSAGEIAANATSYTQAWRRALAGRRHKKRCADKHLGTGWCRSFYLAFRLPLMRPTLTHALLRSSEVTETGQYGS